MRGLVMLAAGGRPLQARVFGNSWNDRRAKTDARRLCEWMEKNLPSWTVFEVAELLEVRPLSRAERKRVLRRKG